MRIFISREIDPTASPFSQMLTAHGHQVHGQSLVLFSPIPFAAIPACDWIFFYSQNAVAFFFENLQQLKIPLPTVKWGAIGAVTAAELVKHIPKVDFCGSGLPEQTAQQFRLAAAGNKVLFPSARHSLHSIKSILGEAIQPIVLEVYDNVAHPAPPDLHDDVLVFTSPLNVTAYFQKHPLKRDQKTVAIGQTTAAALTRCGIAVHAVAAETTEKGLAEAVLGVVSESGFTGF